MPTLNWIGKEKIVKHHHEVDFRALEHRYGFSAKGQQDNPVDSENMIIHGDNLAALKSLLPQYEGRIDCIYIDPPYNTGEKKWVYNDNVSDPQLLKWLGKVVGKLGEDFSRHDKWLCMMYPRLALMRQLLSPKGAIFISNDDTEQSRLKLVCDAIFGENCFVGNIIWQKTYSPRNDSNGIPTATDYITVYGKKPGWKPKRLERTEEMDSKYKNPDNDIALWRADNPYATGGADHQGMVYAIQHPFTGDLLYPCNQSHWRVSQNDLFEIMNGWCEYELRDLDDAEERAKVCNIKKEDVRPGVLGLVLKYSLEESSAKAREKYEAGPWPRYYFTKNGYGGISRKTYLNNVSGKLITNFWSFDEVGHTDGAKKELKRIFEGRCPFDTPKPSSLIERILQIATDDDSIVLDAFAGSGTTAHAVLNQNKKDHGTRKFILIELMDYADTTTAERVKRVITGYAYKGKEEEEIYSKKLTPKNIVRATEFLKEAEVISQMRADEYAKVSKPKIADNCIKVIGTKVYNERMEGVDGDFNFYELGDPLFIDEYTINEEVGEEAIRQYIYYSETKHALNRPRSKDDPYLLDRWDGTAYYFNYQADSLTALDDDVLPLKEKAEYTIYYADVCYLSDDELKALGITFKQIPRDISRF